MIRCLILVLLLTPLASADEVIDALVAKIVSDKPAPQERLDLIDQVLGMKDGGPDALAKEGLKPELDTEILHAVVAGFLKTGKYNGHLPRICALLVVPDKPALTQKVKGRFRQYGNHALRSKLKSLALLDKDSVVRRDAVTGLDCIEHRDALDAIVEVWETDKDTSVRARCRQSVERILAVDNPRAARHLLQSRPLDSYNDFLKSRNVALMNKLQMKVAQHREALAQLLDLLDTKDALRYLDSADEDEREFAAASFRKRAEEGKIKPEDAEAVARVLVQVFDEEIRRPTIRSATLDNVTATLVHFLEDEKLQVEVWKVTTPKKLIASLGDALRNPVVGNAAVSLLQALDHPDALAKLVDVARTSQSKEGRALAIGALGDAVIRNRDNLTYVGQKLAELLTREKEPENRDLIIQKLASAPVPAALEPVADALRAFRGKELKPTDLDSIDIIKSLKGQKALQTLYEMAASHPERALRLKIIQRGLLDRTYDTADQETKTLGRIEELVHARKEPLKYRELVVASLGAYGSRETRLVLKRLRDHEKLEKELRTAAAEAEWKLAERLAKPKGNKLDPQDFATAITLLDELSLDGNAPRMLDLALDVITKGRSAAMPVGSARFYKGWALDKAEDRDDAKVRAAFGEAWDNAKADRLSPEKERSTLERYVDLMEKSDPDAGRLAQAHERLAEIVAASAETENAIKHYLKAADYWTQIKEKPGADRMLEKARGLGANDNGSKFKRRYDELVRKSSGG
ncbi:MAG: hypothetical protein O7E54_12580 [Planctomycetota bacterium]|nr:hypothetical protein [Planctomycetota bacterium]